MPYKEMAFVSRLKYSLNIWLIFVIPLRVRYVVLANHFFSISREKSSLTGLLSVNKLNKQTSSFSLLNKLKEQTDLKGQDNFPFVYIWRTLPSF